MCHILIHYISILTICHHIRWAPLRSGSVTSSIIHVHHPSVSVTWRQKAILHWLPSPMPHKKQTWKNNTDSPAQLERGIKQGKWEADFLVWGQNRFPTKCSVWVFLGGEENCYINDPVLWTRQNGSISEVANLRSRSARFACLTGFAFRWGMCWQMPSLCHLQPCW